MFTRRAALALGIVFWTGTAAMADDGFRFSSIDGGQIDLTAHRGKPVLVVNTASRCGFTDQYDGLQALHEGFGGRVLVLAVPSDDFGGQELATGAEVKEFCEVNFGLTLPMTEITRVRGGDAHPFYRWAAEQGVTPRWNFHKILLDGEGRIVGDFPSSVRPESAQLSGAIEALL
ncbi:glutathione peroxidase [Halovulum dunhuangense]|uniref:Glutathione peroxidase n=1 Tax=Halovulum dunhuangense TaxID=1505036 RepID=A0A849L310_9RHOB|nr:glutathione peroxidase [Halovulum dunhuangense]NNU80620.1 glutathione peroxidase [Halovulum dunhuangense]